MKKIIFYLLVILSSFLGQNDLKEVHMEKAQIIEMVLWESKAGVSVDAAKHAIAKLNDFVSLQPGFVSRQTGRSDDGKFLDIVLWTDLESAKLASEKAMQTEDLIPIFSTIDESSMIFKHFEIFNSIERK